LLAIGTNKVILTATDGAGNSASSTNFILVVDSTPPVVTLLGQNPMTNGCHIPFADPGATASDACSGLRSFTTNGTVNPDVLGNYSVQYIASDGAGNAVTNTRTVYVVDTTPPVVLWSFTNLVLSAGTNCHALMPDVTGTNSIVVTNDCSGPITISQNPTNSALLPIGTNIVLLTATDGAGNTARSTNLILVVDSTPPVVTLLGHNPLTNECHTPFTDPGANASDACSGLRSFTTNGTVNPNVLGDYTIQYIATDGAGNSITNTRLVLVRDTTAPIISNCAPALFLTATASGTATLSNLTALIQATDNCSSNLNIRQVPPADSQLPVGTNTVFFYVDDGNGNTNVCSTLATVTGGTGLTPPVILSQSLIDGKFQLQFTGPDGQSYRVLATTNILVSMTNWLVLTNGVFTGPATFIDSEAGSFPQRYYRLGSP
jgi:hypothetical protein